jgi:hypothetical protein
MSQGGSVNPTVEEGQVGEGGDGGGTVVGGEGAGGGCGGVVGGVGEVEGCEGLRG